VKFYKIKLTENSWIAISSFHKRSQLFVGTHNETVSIVAIGVSNPDCSPFGINSGYAAPTPIPFAEIISDDFPRLRNFVPPFPYNQVTMKGPPTNETIPQPQRQGAARPFPRTESKKKTTDQNETGTF
jgi:hypothetical protein